MIIVGLTGGIGSGKTTVAKMFESLGVPIYISDVEAKRLMRNSTYIKRKIISLFGQESYTDNELNRPFLASRLFKDASLLERMNAIVHPKVAMDFNRWLKKQNSKYVIKEAAIIFEHNMQSQYDYIITVTAEPKDRVARVLQRDNTSESDIMNIINTQMPDEEKIMNSDFVIVNKHLEDTHTQVLKIHQKILKNISKN